MRASRFLVVLACTTALFAACGTTPGHPIAFPVSIAPDDPGTFTTSAGWTITLDEAWIALGPIYAYAPDVPPVIAMLALPVARAHGGHDPFGTRELRAEELEQHVIDLLAPGTSTLGTATGSAGECSDLVIELAPPRDATAGSRGRTLFVAGVAEREGVAIPFEGGLDFPAEGLARFVEGVPLATMMDTGGELVLGVDVTRWLDAAAFDRLTMRSGDRFVIGDGDQAANAWRLGARHPATFSARWRPAR